MKEYKHLIEEIKELESQINCLKKFNKKLTSFDIYEHSENPQNHFTECQTCQIWKNCIDNELETTFYPMVKKEREALLFQGGIGDKCESLPSFYTRHFEKNKICSRNYFFIIYTIIITYY
ncbi:MAG: hypothetical protein ACQBVK_01925 [Candidatus Phytoplasma sp. TWB_XP]